MDSIDDCKSIINNHIEELIFKNINKQELITKKGFKLKNHGKSKIEIYRGIFRICDPIDLDKYNLKSRLITPLIKIKISWENRLNCVIPILE